MRDIKIFLCGVFYILCFNLIAVFKIYTKDLDCMIEYVKQPSNHLSFEAFLSFVQNHVVRAGYGYFYDTSDITLVAGSTVPLLIIGDTLNMTNVNSIITFQEAGTYDVIFYVFLGIDNYSNNVTLYKNNVTVNNIVYKNSLVNFTGNGFVSGGLFGYVTIDCAVGDTLKLITTAPVRLSTLIGITSVSAWIIISQIS